MPPLDAPSADRGSKSESNPTIPPTSSGRDPESALRALTASKDGSALATAFQRKQASSVTPGARSTAQENADIGADGQHLQPPTKKKKKSKMHTCEICSKKFPRPSGLRTHMNTHNNARPYACGFPGCTRTFGVRSNAKRHLRTHGIIPPPSNTSNNNGDAPYVVGFSPPVIAPAPAGSEGAGIASDGPFCVTDGTAMADGESKPRLGRTPFFKLRWMPPSLTSRTNAAKLKVVDEVTGEVSDDETETEDGEDEGDGSDQDHEDPYGDGIEDGRDDGFQASGGARSSMLSDFGTMSMPSLLSFGGTRGGTHSSGMDTLGPTPLGPSRASSYSSLYSLESSNSTSAAADNMLVNQGCVCPFSPCLSTPCRAVSGGVSYISSPIASHSTTSLGTYTQTSALRSMSMPDFTTGSLNSIGGGGMGSLSASSTASSPSSMRLGFQGMFASSGVSIGTSNLYARRLASALHTGHHAHLMASA
ncbi:hypothetical protein NMY22_g3205 [Coprinellus aureogranulatus]|nr:hypothetical protein NMY22_g3205 [Coprinellus aureogranulatus]